MTSAPINKLFADFALLSTREEARALLREVGPNQCA
jgi:hypothetical protein